MQPPGWRPFPLLFSTFVAAGCPGDVVEAETASADSTDTTEPTTNTTTQTSITSEEESSSDSSGRPADTSTTRDDTSSSESGSSESGSSESGSSEVGSSESGSSESGSSEVGSSEVGSSEVGSSESGSSEVGSSEVGSSEVGSSDSGSSEVGSSEVGASESGTDSGGTQSGSTTDDTGVDPDCGNAMVEDGEACDDGNDADGDGCDNDCTATEVVAVATGGQHSCALLDSGTVRCWGLGSSGQLGQGNVDTIGDDELPSTVGTIDLGGTAVQVATGYLHTCARLDDGAVRCWGDGEYGQLGHGSQQDIGDDETPSTVDPIALDGIAIDLVAGYYHSCALLEGGDVRCWGAGNDGQLGLGNTSTIGDDELPTAVGLVDTGDPATQLVVGYQHTCALLVGGAVRCWGGGANGQLGQGNTLTIGDDELPTAVDVVQVGGPVSHLAAGGRHTCAVLDGGNVRCWGAGLLGQLGYGNVATIGDDELPTAVGFVAIDGFAADIFGGFLHTCARLEDDTVRCWGFGGYGGLGGANFDDIGDNELPSSVGVVDLGGPAVQLALVNDHACAVLGAGGVRCWGLGNEGRLGYGDLESVGDDETPAAVGDVPVF